MEGGPSVAVFVSPPPASVYSLFSYTLVEPPDGKYGAPEDNGTWNGMVGMLMRGVSLAVDMSVW